MGLKLYCQHVVFIALAAMFTAASISAARASGQALPLASWRPAMDSFKKAGELIGRDKFDQARAELNSDATSLAAPYNVMAGEYLGRLDKALKTSDPKDFKRLEALVQLCMDLRACDAALRVRAKEGKDADPDDTAIGWRLWETGKTKEALAEYNRRLAAENVDMWRDYWKEQVRLLEQLPTNRTNVPFIGELVQKHYLKGFETKADTFSALEEFTRVLPYAKNAREAVVLHQLIVKNLDSLSDETGRTAWENKLLSDFSTNREACASVYLERGMRAYEKKDFGTASDLFVKVVKEYGDTSAYGDAQFTIALILQQQQKYDEAIAEYAKLFASKVEDYTLPNDGSSADYKCYRFRAAMAISGCYESKKDYPKALEYVMLAKDHYKYLSWCKTCMAEMTGNVNTRIMQMQELVKKGN